MEERFETYADFWPAYLREHSHPHTRAFHYLGTIIGLLLALESVFRFQPLDFIAALIVGYGICWLGHYISEKSRLTSLRYPTWAFRANLEMMVLWLTGRLTDELAKHDILPPKNL